MAPVVPAPGQRLAKRDHLCSDNHSTCPRERRDFEGGAVLGALVLQPWAHEDSQPESQQIIQAICLQIAYNLHQQKSPALVKRG